jgi:SAM-dependent methyltransferase
MNCVLCGSTNQERAFSKVEDWEYQTHAAVNFTRCAECRLIWQEPLPAPGILPTFYPSQYRNFLPGERTLLSELKAIQFRLMGQRVAKCLNKGKILEIGFGNGQLLLALKRLGFCQLFGSDIMNSSFARLQAQGITVKAGNIEESFPFEERFDGIIMNNVLEHLLSPVQVLAALKAHLAPEGRIILATPNASSLELFLFKRYWAGFHAPRHTYIFNQDNILLLKEKLGFLDIQVQALQDPGQWAISAQNFLQDHKRTQCRLKNGLAPYTIPLSIVFAPLSIVQVLLNRSARMLCSFQS